MKNTDRIEILDIFRGIAALEVIIFHYTKYWQTYNNTNGEYFILGSTGVMFFFLISGFVIYLSLGKVKDSSDFLIKRFFRLYPTFWACLCLTIILVYSFGLPGREISVADAFLNITMLPKIFGAKAADGVYWTLVPEFFFYIFMAFVLQFNVKDKVFAWTLPWLALCAVNIVLYPFPGFINWTLNTSYGIYFIAGIMFYKLRTQTTSSAVLCQSIILLCLILAYFSNPTIAEASIITVYFFLFYLFALGHLDSVRFKPALFIGKISYPLYLIHQNIGYIIINKLKNVNGNLHVLYIIIPLILCIAIAYLIHIYIELPSYKWLRNRFIPKEHLKSFV